jgi:hypothetical protein
MNSRTLQTNATYRQFEEWIKNSYHGNNHVYKIEVKMYDGPKPIVLSFTSEQGFNRDQATRKGTIDEITE